MAQPESKNLVWVRQCNLCNVSVNEAEMSLDGERALTHLGVLQTARWLAQRYLVCCGGGGWAF